MNTSSNVVNTHLRVLTTLRLHVVNNMRDFETDMFGVISSVDCVVNVTGLKTAHNPSELPQRSSCRAAILIQRCPSTNTQTPKNPSASRPNQRESTASRTMKTEGIEGTERFASPGKGRGLRALKHFKVGDLVFACPAYAYVLTVNERSSHCEFCFTRREGLSKCGKCKLAFYCDVDCQRGDWPMHKLECSAMCSYGENWTPSETVRLAARIITKQKTLMERTASERVLALSEFEAHLDKLDNEKRELNQTDIVALHHFYSKHLDFPDEEALTELFGQVNCNGFTIEDEELSHLGSAVFPDVALMNHSCSPNVIVTYKGTVAEVRAVQEIPPGDEIFTSYIDLLYPTEDRNERLRDSYFFTCDCNECSTRSKDKAKMEIRKTSTAPEPEEIRSMVRYAKNIIEEFRRAKHYKNILVCGVLWSSPLCS
ncbi:hypothetical protein AAFF_G00361640 [Aldrovandia affinis]|uniref:[histone H3]-lysine(4) N-trimethyltransferase n=1 Tax=Aldrovandia affinis TaxID=143900 RepID=A0AAD7SI97_9TELE|nr:hypothetical protein AAFF_G00361640 [Aldrovandia affinis]